MEKQVAKVYVVAEVDYDSFNIIGVFTSLRKAKTSRAKFRRLIREEWRSHLHLWRKHKSMLKMYRGAPHSHCEIYSYNLNNDTRREEEILKDIKYNKTHTM